MQKVLEKLNTNFINYCDYRKQVIYEAINRNDLDTVHNYSLDHAKTMKIEYINNNIEIFDKFLDKDYLSLIDFNNSDLLETKVTNVFIKEKI